jgi:hypothetical protein
VFSVKGLTLGNINTGWAMAAVRQDMRLRMALYVFERNSPEAGYGVRNVGTMELVVCSAYAGAAIPSSVFYE